MTAKIKYQCIICNQEFRSKQSLNLHLTKKHGFRALRGKKLAMINALITTMGNITAAAKKAEVPRYIHYEWLIKDADYKRHYEMLPDMQVDFYESALNKLVTEGNPAAVIFALKAKGRARGWIERQDVVTDINFTNKTLEEEYKEFKKLEGTDE